MKMFSKKSNDFLDFSEKWLPRALIGESIFLGIWVVLVIAFSIYRITHPSTIETEIKNHHCVETEKLQVIPSSCRRDCKVKREYLCDDGQKIWW
jgi:hypothetical protein